MGGHREPILGADFTSWAEPLIVDCLANIYRRALPNNRLRSDNLAALHVRVWCAIIKGDVATGTRLRRELESEYKAAKLDADTLIEADKAVVEELHAVIRGRFRASRHLSAAYVTPLHQAVQHIRAVKLAA